MKQGLQLWNTPPSLHLTLPSSSSPFLLSNKSPNRTKVISATLESVNGAQLTARERRKLRNERRESNTTNWREEVEDKLLVKPTKKFAHWKEELNLDNLADSGPEWWIVKVSRVNSQETADRLARYIARNFPDLDFKVYAPAAQVKRRLKNGTISVTPKPLFPGCIFLRCVLNKELHDTIRECPGIGGFVGSTVGKLRQINRPKPVSTEDIEAIFRQAKEEQEQADQAFAEDQQKGEIFKNDEMSVNPIINVMNPPANPKTKRKTRKASEPTVSSQSTGADDNLLIPGSSVRVVAGSFSEFKGSLKNLDHKSGKATVGFMLFGKESLVDLQVDQIIAET